MEYKKIVICEFVIACSRLYFQNKLTQNQKEKYTSLIVMCNKVD